MIGRLPWTRASFCSKRFTQLVSLIVDHRSSFACRYHSDSIDQNLPEEPAQEEQRLSSQEATKILRTHEASIDLEARCPVKYYEVNYLGANNPPGMCGQAFVRPREREEITCGGVHRT